MEKIIQVDFARHCGQKVGTYEIPKPEFSMDEPIEWVKITAKPMDQILNENACAYFDGHGNLCGPWGHLSPHYFGQLGLSFHVKIGCGWTDEKMKYLITSRTL